ARGFCPRSTMRVPQPDIIEHFGNADAVPQLPERCLSRKAGIVRCCHKTDKAGHCIAVLRFSIPEAAFSGSLSAELCTVLVMQRPAFLHTHPPPLHIYKICRNAKKGDCLCGRMPPNILIRHPRHPLRRSPANMIRCCGHRSSCAC
ncbi:MAG: hypothetical protein MR806_09565, partial [Subdoligranulum sp.]|nr:hypothetical protein [Subdoligranulum sp.]